MKISKPQSIGEIIIDMIEEYGMRAKLDKVNVEASWNKVVGPSVSAYTSAVRLEGRLLHVYLTSAPLKEELGYMRESLTVHINRTVGRDAIDSVIIH